MSILWKTIKEIVPARGVKPNYGICHDSTCNMAYAAFVSSTITSCVVTLYPDATLRINIMDRAHPSYCANNIHTMSLSDPNCISLVDNIIGYYYEGETHV